MTICQESTKRSTLRGIILFYKMSRTKKERYDSGEEYGYTARAQLFKALLNSTKLLVEDLLSLTLLTKTTAAIFFA